MPRGNWQAEFAGALLAPEAPLPSGVCGPEAILSEKRFGVYRNNVFAGLIDALSETFPVTRRIVGGDFFAAMARLYVATDPPRSPILLQYGAGFADFIDTFEPASGIPYLGDVCRTEWAWLEAYHSLEVLDLTPIYFRNLSPSHIPGLRLTLHPSVRLLRSKFPTLTIWRTNTHDNSPVPVDLEAGNEHVLISRPEAEVEIRCISAAMFAFLQALASDATILQATEIALNADPQFALEEAFAVLIQSKLIAGYRTANDICEEND